MALGVIWGLNSGKQSGDGKAVNSGSEGILFDGTINRTSAPGEGQFINVVTAITNGNPNGCMLANNATGRWTTAVTLPLIDTERPSRNRSSGLPGVEGTLAA